MSKSFQIALTEAPEILVARAKQTASDNAATFRGDTTSGHFSGSGVEGHYEIHGETITVTITSKPFLAPWSVVESRVKEFFA